MAAGAAVLGRRRRYGSYFGIQNPALPGTDESDLEQFVPPDVPEEAAPTAAPALTPGQIWAMQRQRAIIEGMPPMPMRRSDLGPGGYAVGGETYKPSTMQKIIGYIQTGLRGAGGGDTGQAAREYFDRPYMEAMQQYGATRAGGQQEFKDLSDYLRAEREAEAAMELGRQRQATAKWRTAQAANLGRTKPGRATPAPFGVPQPDGSVQPAQGYFQDGQYHLPDGTPVPNAVPLPKAQPRTTPEDELIDLRMKKRQGTLAPDENVRLQALEQTWGEIHRPPREPGERQATPAQKAAVVGRRNRALERLAEEARRRQGMADPMTPEELRDRRQAIQDDFEDEYRALGETPEHVEHRIPMDRPTFAPRVPKPPEVTLGQEMGGYLGAMAPAPAAAGIAAPAAAAAPPAAPAPVVGRGGGLATKPSRMYQGFEYIWDGTKYVRGRKVQ